MMNTGVDGRIFRVRGKTGSFANCRANSTFSFSKGRVNRGLVAQNKWLNELVVQQQGPVACRWVHQPKQENAFGQVVEWNPEKEDVGEKFEKREESVGDPIGEPFGIVILLFAFNRLDGGISGVNESNEVAKEGGAVSNDQVESRQCDQAQNNKESRYFRFILKLCENVGEKVLLMERLIQSHPPAFVGGSHDLSI